MTSFQQCPDLIPAGLRPHQQSLVQERQPWWVKRIGNPRSICSWTTLGVVYIHECEHSTARWLALRRGRTVMMTPRQMRQLWQVQRSGSLTPMMPTPPAVPAADAAMTSSPCWLASTAVRSSSSPNTGHPRCPCCNPLASAFASLSIVMICKVALGTFLKQCWKQRHLPAASPAPAPGSPTHGPSLAAGTTLGFKNTQAAVPQFCIELILSSKLGKLLTRQLAVGWCSQISCCLCVCVCVCYNAYCGQSG